MPLMKGQTTGKLSQKQLDVLKEGRKLKFDEPKDQRFSAALTKTGKEGLLEVASHFGVKPVDLLEMIGRGEIRLEKAG